MAQNVADPVLTRPSLYDRLGGVYNIATVVDDLIDRIMGDPRLNANPRVDERIRRFKARVDQLHERSERPPTRDLRNWRIELDVKRRFSQLPLIVV